MFKDRNNNLKDYEQQVILKQPKYNMSTILRVIIAGCAVFVQGVHISGEALAEDPEKYHVCCKPCLDSHKVSILKEADAKQNDAFLQDMAARHVRAFHAATTKHHKFTAKSCQTFCNHTDKPVLLSDEESLFKCLGHEMHDFMKYSMEEAEDVSEILDATSFESPDGKGGWTPVSAELRKEIITSCYVQQIKRDAATIKNQKHEIQKQIEKNTKQEAQVKSLQARLDIQAKQSTSIFNDIFGTREKKQIASSSADDNKQTKPGNSVFGGIFGSREDKESESSSVENQPSKHDTKKSNSIFGNLHFFGASEDGNSSKPRNTRNTSSTRAPTNYQMPADISLEEREMIKSLEGRDFGDLGTDGHGFSPLREAILNDHLEVVKYLDSKGVDLNTELLDQCGVLKRDNTPLSIAVTRNKLRIIKYLDNRGVNLSTPNKLGWTALQYAAYWGHLDVIKYLESRGIDLSAPIGPMGAPMISDLPPSVPSGYHLSAGIRFRTTALLTAKKYPNSWDAQFNSSYNENNKLATIEYLESRTAK